MNAQTPIGLGHNSPLGLKDMLAEAYAPLNQRIAEALASAARAPEVIEDDAVLGKFGDLTKHMTDLAKEADGAREGEKAPFLSAGREVDAFFKPNLDEIASAKKTLLGRSTKYLSDKEAKARAEAQAAAARAQEEAETRLREAERAQDRGDTDGALVKLAQAEAAESIAVDAQVAATAKPADMARTYSTGGSVSTLKKEWTFEVQERAAIPLDQLRPYLAADAVDKAIRAYVKAGNRTLAGVRIYEAPKAMVR